MLFRQDDLEGIARGDITVAFRRWVRPTVKTGGTLTTAAGVLAIDEVERVPLSAVTPEAARAAGRASAAELRAELDRRAERPLFRVRFHLAGEDPRIALREDDDLSPEDVEELRLRLDRLDANAPQGAWTRATLALIGASPGVRAPELASQLDLDAKTFKARVRRLKSLGLTESLQIGYRLSPRGEALAARLGVAVASEGASDRPPAPPSAVDDADALLAFFEEHGVVMQAAAGPVPTLTYVIAGEAFSRTWRGHPRAPRILELLRALAADPSSLGCRLFQGKKVWVHERLWPHLACLAPRLPAEHTDVVEEDQEARGALRLRTTPLLTWLPDDALQAAGKLSEEEALDGLGWWVADELLW